MEKFSKEKEFMLREIYQRHKTPENRKIMEEYQHLEDIEWEENLLHNKIDKWIKISMLFMLIIVFFLLLFTAFSVCLGHSIFRGMGKF